MNAALLVSLIALLASGLSVWFTLRADRRATRAEAQSEAAERVAALERVGGIMREVAAIARGAAKDPMASSHLHTARARLGTAIASVGVDLPAC